MRQALFILIILVLSHCPNAFAAEPSEETQRIEELTLRLEELTRKYDLAVQGMRSGSTGVGLAWVFGILLLIGTFIATLKDKTLMSGWALFATTLTLVAGLVIYFAFIFDREAEIRAELSETNKSIQLATTKCP
jgi:hypothetical protein